MTFINTVIHPESGIGEAPSAGKSSGFAINARTGYFILLIVLLLMSLPLPLINLGKLGVGSSYEARVVKTGETMAESGDWVVPYFNGKIRLQKPPLPYWTIGIMNKTFGPLNEWLFRLPSAVMGIVGILMTLITARIMFGWQIGLLAAIIQSLTIKYIIESRQAEVDIYVTFWTSVSLCVLSLLFFGNKRRDWLWPLMWACVGMSFFSKWFNVFLFVLPPMIYGLWTFKSRRGAIRWHIVGILIFAGMGLLWVGMLIHSLGWHTVYQEWFHEINTNIVAPKNKHHFQFFYYVLNIFTLTFPWSLLIPVALTIPFWPYFKEEQRKLTWLAATIFGSMVILSLVSKKKVNYIMPALPFMVILEAKLAGFLISADTSSFQSETKKRYFNIFAICNPVLFVIMGSLVGIYAFVGPERDLRGLIFITGCVLCITGYLSFRFVDKGKRMYAMICLFFGISLFNYGLFGIFLPSETRTSSAHFADDVKKIVGNSPIVFYLGRDETLVYYLKRTIPLVMNTEDLDNILNKNPDTFVLVKEKYLKDVLALADYIALNNPRYQDNSIPFIKEKYKNIYLLRKGTVKN